MDAVRTLEKLLQNPKKAENVLKNENLIGLITELCRNENDRDCSVKAFKSLCYLTKYANCLELMRKNQSIVELSKGNNKYALYLRKKLFPKILDSNKENSSIFSTNLIEVDGIEDTKSLQKFKTNIAKLNGVKSIVKEQSDGSNRFKLKIDNSETDLKFIAVQMSNNGFYINSVVQNEFGYKIVKPIISKPQPTKPAYPQTTSRLKRSDISRVNVSDEERNKDTFVESLKSFFQNSFYW